jgi:hypothetical protein
MQQTETEDADAAADQLQRADCEQQTLITSGIRRKLHVLHCAL